MMNKNLDMKRIVIFLAFAFGLAWVTSLVVYLTGGLAHSPVLVPGTGITLAIVLLATLVMWSPGLAHLLTRWLTGEGWQTMYLRPKFKRGWSYWLAAWFLPGILSIGGIIVFFGLFPRYYDPSLSTLKRLIESSAPPGAALPEFNLWTIVVIQTVQAMLIAPLINSVATFGEELGWRAYLQPKLMSLGGRKAMVVMGVIWGVWHWPVILMGYNYGFDYPGAPFLGPLAMVWFTFIVGTFLGWVTLKAGSVWPAVIGHAAINGIAGLGMLFIQGQPNTLLGPTPVGVIGGIGLAIVALLIFFSPGGLSAPEEPPPAASADEAAASLPSQEQSLAG